MEPKSYIESIAGKRGTWRRPQLC